MLKKMSFRGRSSVLLGLGIALTMCGATSVYALDYELQQTIVDPNAVVDVCPNIGGVQASIPSGMILDEDGNCYTPAPTPTPVEPTEPTTPVTPATPVVTDLCSNLSGVQIALPSGYYRTTKGLCYAQPAQPAEPVDVCGNLDGTQSDVPDGYYLATDNTCQVVPADIDVCDNIDGAQTSLPDGMTVDDGECYTPAVTQPTQKPTTPTKTGSSLANVPEALTPIIQPLVNLVPESTRTWLKSLPPAVAKTTPYYIFMIVGLLALGVLLQSIREAEFIKQLVIMLKRERDIAEQKDTFIALASHYLRTPLALMESGLDTIVALKELPAETVEPLKQPLGTLKAKIDNILSDIQNNSALHGIQAPVPSTDALPSVWRSPFFWGPLVASVLLSLLANFLFGIVGNQAIGTGNIIFQTIFGLAVLIVLYITVRNLFVKRKLHEEHERLIAHERTIDDARNTFITQATFALKDSLTEVNTAKPVIAAAPSASFFENGYERFRNILEKFLLLGHIQTGAERALETIEVRPVIDATLVRYQNEIAAKNLTVTNTVDSLTIQQNRTLFEFVVASLIDNAVKFNDNGGAITISAEPNVGTLRVSVSDNGIGIDEAKLSQLFQPFSRATSTMEFNYEGLGFSLFLDKIIMDYTGGTITAESELKRGTNLTVTSPLV